MCKVIQLGLLLINVNLKQWTYIWGVRVGVGGCLGLGVCVGVGVCVCVDKHVCICLVCICMHICMTLCVLLNLHAHAVH